MRRLGFELRTVGWNARTNPMSYGAPPPSEKSNLYEQNVTVGQRVDQSLGT